MSESAGSWWLAAQVEPSGPDAKLEIALQRKLDTAEARQAREANAVVQRLASVAPYARLVVLYHELEQTLVRDLSARRRAIDMNRVARALGKSAGDLPDDLRRNARDYFDSGNGKLQELEQAIGEETRHAEFAFLVAIGQHGHELFLAVDDAITVDSDILDEIGGIASEVRSVAGAMGLLRSGVVIAQRLISRQLLIYQERIEDASLFLRRLAADS